MNQTSIYPPGPSAVPADLTAASKTYRRHAWFAVLGLLGFVAAYFGLMIWLAILVWRHVHDLSAGQSSNVLVSILLVACAGFLFIFMAKPLFSIQRGHTGDDLELNAAEHPAFFAFLYRLADEAGAPRPKRVYVSARVNAGVFYDLSILNLIFPSQKNLEIGLALVNVLSLGELKAVLAHEFGHFAQRSMAVGRWVYIAQQIAGHIVAQRGALDRFVAGLSRVDLRVAWVGWLLSLIIWSIRSLVELMFRLVVLAQRALSREMEYQADLVATALTGSDALVHALHKLGAADEAWQRTLAFADDELRAGRVIDDLFAVQTRIIEHLRAVQADPHFGVAPPVIGNPEQHRVFKDSLAKPPAMWSTHPENTDRESNVKRRYVAAEIDPRPAWELFQSPDALRQKVTRQILQSALKEPDTVTSAPITDTLSALDQQFARPSLDRRYRGSYLNRALTRHTETLAALFEGLPAGADLLAMADGLYGDDHDQDLDRERALSAEAASIQGLIDGALTTGSKTIRWRGEEIRKQDLPKTLAAIQAELDAVRASLHRHDRRCRSVHRAMAEAVGEGWASYLEGLLGLMHFAEHSRADLHDTQRILANTFRVVTADKSVSQTELKRLITDCNQVQRVLAQLRASAPDVVLDPNVLAHLNAVNWDSRLGELRLPEATQDNISPWLDAVDGWISQYSLALSDLQQAVLEVLLATEQRVLEAFRQGQRLESAPAPSRAPGQYVCLLPGKERPVTLKLSFWDRFQSADGMLATGLRLSAAGGILGSLIWLSATAGDTSLVLHNGFSQAVKVQIDQRSWTVPAHSEVIVDLTHRQAHQVSAWTSDAKQIEQMTLKPEQLGAKTVYNIGNSSSLAVFTAAYGTASAAEPRFLGNPLVSRAATDYLFEEPPERINTKSSGEVRDTLMALDDASVSDQVNLAPESSRKSLVRAHVLWEPDNSEVLQRWLEAALDLPDGRELLQARADRDPHSVQVLRLLQDIGSESEQAEACTRQRAAAEKNPDHGGLRYLAIRCERDPGDQNQQFIDAAAAFPDEPWLRFASAHVLSERGDWAAALSSMSQAYAALPPGRLQAGLEIVRLSSLLDRLDQEPAASILAEHKDLAAVLAIGEGQTSPELPFSPAYAALHRGDLSEAVSLAEGDVAAPVTILAAASDGADQRLIESALALEPTEALGLPHRFLRFALAERIGRASQRYREQAFAQIQAAERARLEAFIEQAAFPDQAEAQLRDLPIMYRASAYAYACTRQASACPSAWRRFVDRYLLPMERPFHRSPP